MEELKMELTYVSEMIDNCTGSEFLAHLRAEALRLEKVISIASLQE